MKLVTLLHTLTFIFLSQLTIAQYSFTPSVTSGCAPLGVDFMNTSSSGTYFDWDFGDGTTVTNVTSPSHIYTTGGQYYVTMTAYGAGMSYLGQSTMTIDVIGAPSEIHMDSDLVCPGDVIEIWVNLSGNSTLSWDFGDGTTSASNYNTHTYSAPGTYYPSVTISTTNCGNFILQDTITVSNSLPFFGGAPYLGLSTNIVCPLSEINGSTPDKYPNVSWDFGNGNVASGNEATWSYSLMGNYNVQATITNGCGVDTTIIETIGVSNTVPVENANFSVPDTVCPGESFYLHGNSNNGVQYDFDMGDGSALISDEDFQYTYVNSGTYNITLTVTNACGNTDVVNQTIVVSPLSTVDNPFLNVSNNYVCPGDVVYFFSNNEYTYYIDYGDGSGSNKWGSNNYDTPGNYVIVATIQNACGNTATLIDTVHVQSSLSINTNNIWLDAHPPVVCPGDEINFSVSSGYFSYDWNFGDGTSSPNESTGHVFNAPGIYNVTVEVTNGCGHSQQFGVNAEVNANLAISDIHWGIYGDTICPGDAMFFEVDAIGDLDYVWYFGDGDTSALSTDSHTYTGTGVYQIELNATNSCGNDTTVYDSLVVINNHQPDVNDYEVFVQEEGCVGDEIYFGLAPGGAANISWDFGDGTTTSTTETIPVYGNIPLSIAFHTYNSPGIYWAVYTITNSCGNSITDSLKVDIGTVGDNQSIGIDFWWDESQTACQGQPIEFMAVGGATYIWDFGDGSGKLVTNSTFSPVYHSYDNPGNYIITVNSINQCGNKVVTNDDIFIPQSQMEINTNTVTEPNCGMHNGMAIASVTGGHPPYNYSWTNGDNGVIADSLSSGLYVITITDNHGCSNESIATVSDEEGVTILVDNIVDVNCYGNDNGSISVSILGGQPPYTILWSNGDQTEDIFGLQAGPYEIFVTDANGCFSVESIEVLQPQKANVSIISQSATCGLSNGSAIASVNNGTGPYNYIWPNTTGPSSTSGGFAAGTYELLVIDGNTCLLQEDFVINEIGGPIIITDSTITGTCNGLLSSIYLSTIGGTPPFNYTWSDGTPNEDLIGVLPGEYTIEIESDNGCSSFAKYELVESQPNQIDICMVDVDSLSGTNLVVWSPLNGAGIESYNIYKESSQAGLYYLIGNSSADSISQYFDYLSDPFIRSWRYKVSAVDNCGNESELSDEHKTIHLTSNMGIAGEVNLIWDHYQGFSYPTYYINRYHPTTGWMILDSLASNLSSYTDPAPPSDSNLVYMVTIATPGTCTAFKASDYNSSRSNKEGINLPDDNNSGGANIEEEIIALQIYPNPSNGIVQINYSNKLDAIRLYDLRGKLVYVNESIDHKTVSFDLSSFERGVYTLEITSNGEIINGKVVRN